VIYILDILGVFAFSFLGACTALQGRLNAIGVLTCAFLSSLGGGTIREVMLDHVPFYFHDRRYLLTVLLACVMAWIIRDRLPLLMKVMPVLDAIGLVVFAYIGANAAGLAHLGLSGMLLFALLTAMGGGILSDLVAHQTPKSSRMLYMPFHRPCWLCCIGSLPIYVISHSRYLCFSHQHLQCGCLAFMAEQH
jgi:uncharacterized membrane protein YeiH